MVCAIALLLLASPVNPYSARTLVVMNADSPTSLAIGTDYATKRGVGTKMLIRCQDSAEAAQNETIAYSAFRDSIESPIRAYLAKHPKIDFIVLTKGVPLRIDGPTGFGINGTRMSLDSYLAGLDYDRQKGAVKVTLTDTGFTGTAWANRFWNSQERFSHAKFGGYLVTRLDGYTEEAAEQIVAWALAAEKQKPVGTFLLDVCPSFGISDASQEPVSALSSGAAGIQSVKELEYKHFNADMVKAESLLKKLGMTVELEQTDAFVAHADLMGYASWGSNDSHFSAGNYAKLRFAPGGIAETAVSTSARTFLPTTGGQSLIADLIAARATGAKGYCDEPLLQAVACPSILFDRYARGWTLAESFYAASRFVAWEDVVVGDPICQPFRR